MSDINLIDKQWKEYDKYNRNLWPGNAVGGRAYLVELDDGQLKVSNFYANPDPEWGFKEMDEDDVVVRFADLEDFRKGSH